MLREFLAERLELAFQIGALLRGRDPPVDDVLSGRLSAIERDVEAVREAGEVVDPVISRRPFGLDESLRFPIAEGPGGDADGLGGSVGAEPVLGHGSGARVVIVCEEVAFGKCGWRVRRVG